MSMIDVIIMEIEVAFMEEKENVKSKEEHERLERLENKIFNIIKENM